jgi:hypothetical protein
VDTVGRTLRRVLDGLWQHPLFVTRSRDDRFIQLFAAGVLAVAFIAALGDDQSQALGALGLAAVSALSALLAVRQAREARYEERSYQLLERFEALAGYMSELGERVAHAVTTDKRKDWSTAAFTQRKARVVLAALGDPPGLKACREALEYEVGAANAQTVYDSTKAGLVEIEKGMSVWAEAHRWA